MSEQEPPQQPGLIEIRVVKLVQLFHGLDPYPFREKDLDKDAEEFIVSWARELPRDTPFEIVVHVPEEQLALPEAQDVGPAIKQFFAYRAQVITLELKELFRIGRRSLAIGFTILVLSVVASQTIARKIEPRPLGKVIEESLLIFAWVANWRPIEIFFYEWWPIVRRRDLYRRLGEADVELRPYTPGEERRLVLPKQ
ncbi:MAG TPA: hypothetical protein VLD66_02685 [Methyloceanibacter sp.]|nr:hypothetical protein [Methyloceanibacter sp.]